MALISVETDVRCEGGSPTKETFEVQGPGYASLCLHRRARPLGVYSERCCRVRVSWCEVGVNDRLDGTGWSTHALSLSLNLLPSPLPPKTP